MIQANKKMAPPKKSKNFQSKYFDIKNPTSYAGKAAFLRGLKPSDKKKADRWLDSQLAYAAHKPVPKKFKRLKVVAAFRQQVQGDLIDLTKLSAHNDKHRYVFTVIDAFSRLAHAEPLKNKDAASTSKAFEKILKKMKYKPLYFFSDNGSEFKGAFRTMLKKNGIQFYTSKDKDIKASIVERFNRSLMARIYRYFTKNETKNYIKILPDIIKNYNGTHHSSIGRPPVSVSHKNKEQVWLKLHHSCGRKKRGNESKLPKFKIGDAVLIPKNRSAFAKSYESGWSTEVFRIRRIKKSDPVTYDLEDLKGEPIAGVFYAQELQKAPAQEFFEVESVLDARGNKILVKWKNYSDRFNQWIPKRNLRVS